MALDRVFDELKRKIRKVSEALQALHLAVFEDRPLRDADNALLDSWEFTADDCLGWSKEASATIDESAGILVEDPVDLNLLRRCLAKGHDQMHRISRLFLVDLDYDRMEELMQLGRERGGEWKSWATGVKDSLERCLLPIHSASLALSFCWQEIAERVGAGSVSVKSTNIGQEITVRDPGSLVRDEVT